MREVFFKRNENTPIYITQKNLEFLQKRKNISELRAKYAKFKKTARVKKRAKYKKGKFEINNKSEIEKKAIRILFYINKTIANLCANIFKRFKIKFFERMDREKGDKGKFKRDLQILHVNPQKFRYIAINNVAVKIG